MKKQSSNTKLNELKAIAAFGQNGNVAGIEVSPNTAKTIIGFHDQLETQKLKNQFLLFDARQMKSIALGSIQSNAGGLNVQLTPEAKFLVNLGKQSLNGLGIIRKKYIVPVLEKLNKKAEEKKTQA